MLSFKAVAYSVLPKTGRSGVAAATRAYGASFCVYPIRRMQDSVTEVNIPGPQKYLPYCISAGHWLRCGSHL